MDPLANHEVSDSGEETESFENGALTPTLSEEIDGDEELDKDKSAPSGYDASSPTPSPSIAHDSSNRFDFGRLNLGGGPQVSFSPNVLAYHSDNLGAVVSRSERAPSIAATAGSSRAPSTRGVSPPASLSRAATTESSSIEEFDSMGTGMGGSGAETPSIVRSRRSSYSAPSSEVEPSDAVEGGDVGTRSRGATLIPASHALLGSSTNLTDEPEDNAREGPSLAPSEAGSDSTRSMTQDSSSLGHGLYPYTSSGGIAVGGHGSSDRLANYPSSNAALAGTSSPGTFEPPSPGDFASSKGTVHPVLPSLLAIKKAGRRFGSGAASTVATAGTTSPASNLSVEGDFEDAPQSADLGGIEQH